MAGARSVVDVMLGEATSGTTKERYDDMRAIASAIVNRAVALNVSPESVVSAPGQFSAYGKSLPKGTAAFRGLAEKALADVMQNGPSHFGTFYATHKRVGALPPGLTKVATTKAHSFFDDPQNRAIETSFGTTKVNVAQKQLAQAWAAQNLAAAQTQTQATNKRTPTRGTTVSELGATVPTGLTSPFGVLGDRITSNFGPRTAPKTKTGYGSTDHMGTDLSLGATAGYAAEAIAGGQVKHAGPLGKLGNAVTISHPDGTTSTYGHLSSVNVAVGDTIARGTPIGTVGETGNAKGPHLHLSMKDKFGNVIDPASMIDFNRTTRVPTPTARPTTTPQATPETAVSAFSTTRNVNPAVAAINAQMNPTADQTSQSFATQQAAQRQAASAEQQRATQQRAAQAAAYGEAQRSMQQAMAQRAADQQARQLSAKKSPMSVDTRAALAGNLNDQRQALTSQTPIGIAGRTIGAMAGSFATPTQTKDTFAELAGKVTNAADAVARAKPSIANALNKQTADLTSRQVSQPSVGPQPAMNALSNVASSIDPAAMAKSVNGFMNTPLGSFTKNTALGTFAQGLALAADVTTPDVAPQLAAGVTPQDVFGTTLAPISLTDDYMTPQVTTSALASYAPSDVTGSVLSGALNDMERAGTDFAGGATGLSAVDRNAADNLPGRYGPRAGIALGGLLGSVLGGPIGGLLGAMAGGSLANRSGPAGGTGGLLGGMFGGSYSGDGNQGPGPGGRDSAGSRGAGVGNSGGGSRKNEQGSRR